MTVIAYGSSVHLALRAAEELDEDIEVLDLRTLAPLDRDGILASARKTGKVLVAHEATRTCGVGAEVAALIAEESFEDLDAPVRRLTAPDVPIPFSPPLEQAVLVELLEHGARLEQLGLRAARGDAAVVEHHHLVGERDRREAVGDDDRRPAAHRLAQALADRGLGGRVDRGGGVVEDQDARVDQQRAGDRDALPLAAGQRDAALADDGLVAFWKVGDVFVEARDGGGF